MRGLFFKILFLGILSCCGITQLKAQTSCAILDAGPDVTVDCSNPCTNLSAEFIGIPNTNTSSYTIGEPSCTLPPISGGTPSNLITDNEWSEVINIPFNFNFFQNNYSQLVICANGQISFDTSLAGTDNGYTIGPSELLPTTSRTFTLNTIYGAYHDLNPSLSPDPSQINYLVSGTAPFRTFIINFFEVEHSVCASLKTTQQVILYESSNVIEVNLINKPICTSWNGGRATLGIQGNDLTEFAVPPGRNTGVWSASNENYRFIPDGPQDPNTAIVWTDPSGIVVGTGAQINVCPPFGTTTYTATLTFDLPNGTTSSVTDDVDVTSTAMLVTPEFTQIDPICAGEPLGPFPTTSNNGITGNWAPSPDNTVTTPYVFTPDNGQCAVSVEMTVAVIPLQNPTFNQVPPICSGDPLDPLPTTSLNGYTGTWSPAINNTAPTLYTFTPDTGECATTAQMFIDVEPIRTPTFAQVPPICSGDPLDPLPTTSLNGITGAWSPALNNTATTLYTFTPDTGECASTAQMFINVEPIRNPTFDQVPPVCSGEPLDPLPTTSLNGFTGTWSPAINNTAPTLYTFTPDTGECATTAQMFIDVVPIETPTFDQVPPICSGDSLDPLPTTSLNGLIGTWSPSINNTMTTTYTFTPDAGQCAILVMMTIVVNDLILPTFTQVTPICNGDPLEPLPTISLNGIEGAWSPSLDNTTTNTYTFTPNDDECAVIAQMTIEVNENITPTFNQVLPICEGDILNPLPTTSLNGIEGTWSPALDNTMETTYTFTPLPEECAVETTMTIEVLDVPRANAPTDTFTICDNEGAIDDGRAIFDFNDLSNPDVVALRKAILAGQNEPDFNLSFYETLESSEDGTPAINFPYLSRQSPQTLFARVENLMTGCYAVAEVTIAVNSLPAIDLEDTYRICVDDTDAIITEQSGGPSPPVLDTGLNTQDYTFVWEQDGTVLLTETGASIIAIEIGVYKVTVVDKRTGCENSSETQVVFSSPPFTWNVKVTTAAFSDNPTIEAEATGLGNYKFQLDSGPFQDEGVFENVQRGIHIVTITDANGCGSVSIEVNVIDFPRFITPNEDGYHDTWNISSLSESDPNAKIYIYDRYGKLLTLITPSTNGWDGTFNGTPLPSNDYWFSAEYMLDGKQKVFKGHFSLKR